MACVDAPYIIQGGLPQIGWWTWHQWKMYQLWLGWPLADLWWQMTWDALFFYVLWRAVPHLDARRSNTVTLLGFPLAAAVGINLVAPLLHIPLILVTYLGTPQWPLVVALVLGYVIVAVRAMRLSPADFVEPVTVIVAGIYVLSMAVMVIGNALYEKGLTEYIAVQSAALIILCGFVAYPALRGRSRRVPATDAESHTSRSDRAADPMDTDKRHQHPQHQLGQALQVPVIESKRSPINRKALQYGFSKDIAVGDVARRVKTSDCPVCSNSPM